MKRKYGNEDDYEAIRPPRKHKYYLRNRWIFTVAAILIVAIFTVVKFSYQKQPSEDGTVCATVLYVVDGDTVDVDLNGVKERVRLIGVDAPESVSAEESENSVYGELASEYTREHLKEGTVVYLMFDSEKRDRYDRLLAYVWLEDALDNTDHLFQKQLVEDGYARAVSYEPNTLYRHVFEESMGEAIVERNGLWAYEDFYKMYYDD
ncbi:MAG: thermonuclease family protein [Lachnospiraceae bacterium]|nr:thermonuclease family protein [Lachnospiraceae bacterium]